MVAAAAIPCRGSFFDRPSGIRGSGLQRQQRHILLPFLKMPRPRREWV